MKSIAVFFAGIIISVNILDAQVSFAGNGQQINNCVGRGVVVNDFNGDGFLDAFIINQNDYRIYFGDGRGGFVDSGQRLAAVADASGKPGVFDLNGDGRVEVITGSTVWLIDSLGNFTATLLSIESTEIVDLGTMRFADLNGDGHPDLFALHNYSASRVYLNDGLGNFHDTGQRLGDSTIGTGQLAKIALGDINGDGSIDAVTAGWRWPPGSAGPCPNRVWLNDGHGNFHESGQLLDIGDSHVHGLELGDMNGDGRPDLVMGIQDAVRSGRIYLNDGNGNLHDSGVRLGAHCCWDVAVGDFNVDGKLDAFTADCIWTSSGLIPAPASIWLNTTITAIIELRDGDSNPWEYALSQNYPNPFNPSTVIRYRLPFSGEVTLKIYNTIGQEIKKLVDGFQNAGEYSSGWDGHDGKSNPVSSGIYYYRLQTVERTVQKKMVLLR